MFFMKSKSRKIYIFGESHIDCVRAALKKRTESPQCEVVALRFSREKNGVKIGDVSVDEAKKLASKLSENDLLVSMTGGNQHQVLGLVQHERPFDFYRRDTLNPVDLTRHTLIPYQVVRALLESGLSGKDWPRIQALQKAASCRMVHVTPPAPKSDESHILRKFETQFADLDITNRGVTPADIRLKLWRTQVDALKGLCDSEGIELLPPPNGTLCANGFLKMEFYANDATHANAAYGELILQQLEAIISV